MMAPAARADSREGAGEPGKRGEEGGGGERERFLRHGSPCPRSVICLAAEHRKTLPTAIKTVVWYTGLKREEGKKRKKGGGGEKISDHMRSVRGALRLSRLARLDPAPDCPCPRGFASIEGSSIQRDGEEGKKRRGKKKQKRKKRPIGSSHRIETTFPSLLSLNPFICNNASA